MTAGTLISTVGTSLFYPNLATLRADDPDLVRQRLAAAYAGRDWLRVAAGLKELDPAQRLCGAEINSLASLFDKGYALADCNLFFCHSATQDGLAVGTVLREYYHDRHPCVELLEIEDLQDADPRRFRTRGLRNLAKKVCQVIRSHGADYCAINATGGYKAQIAVSVLMGQALGVPVYYKHERFDEIVAFPPLPVALDFGVWMRASGMLFDLESAADPVLAADYADDWDERYESLVERVAIDGTEYLELSPTGQIFQETFRTRFRSHRDQVLPPAVPESQKHRPRWEDSGHMRNHPEILTFMQAVTDQVPQVVHCTTFYFNPDLPARPRFRMGSDGIEGIFSDGTWCVKFRVETSAATEGQRHAVVAQLNEWLSTR